MARTRSRTVSDIEKRRPSDDGYGDSHDDDPDSGTSSPSTSSQHVPMLNRAYPHRDRRAPLLRLRPSIMRYACLGVAGILLLFMVSLVRFSHQSQKEVEKAIIQDKQTPKPPMWENFPFLERYYGGVRSLIPRKDNVPEYPPAPEDALASQSSADKDRGAAKEDPDVPAKRSIEGRAAVLDSVVFDPYPDYKSEEYINTYGEKVDCFLDQQNTVQIPRVRVYESIPRGFPDSVMGSAELLGMRNDICYDRFGRLGPYGLGYSLNKGGSGAQQEGEREGADRVWLDSPEVDFRAVKWADVQQRCNAANAHRFKELPEPRTDRFRSMRIGSHARREADDDNVPSTSIPAKQTPHKPRVGKSKIPRTAVVIRTWWDYNYTTEDIMYLRSIISELNVLSGGKYTLHFLIHVKDDNAQIWADDDVYERVLRDALPEEFRGMGTLWTERQMFLVYGGLEESWMRGLPVHGVYRSTFMPMQYFAYQHPEYDYFWHWEMDIRTTNHWYHLFESVSAWARKQPRKYLWERNARFYVPAEHGTWDDFSHMVRIQTDQGTNSANNVWSGLRAGGREPGSPDQKMSGDRPVWGPERPLDDNVTMSDIDEEPPTSFERDKYSWGVDEDADLITFNPLFDPDGTTWLLADDTTGYNITRGRPPRRTAIITASRHSRKLLMAMHRELSQKRHSMFSEMWPASCALHHGLKAVYVPHPVYVDRRWPTSYLEKTFNGGRNGATGGARTSVFGDREHNFRGTTWYYNAGFSEVLWHRWLGMKIFNAGGELVEMEGEGRMCLPGMMLHPIKRVELPQEGKKAD